MEPEAEIAEKKCLFIINQGAPFKAVHDHIKKLNGLYNGVGWYVENKHKEAVSQMCENVSLRCLEDFPFLEESFDALRRKLKAPYFIEKSFKKSRARKFSLQRVESDRGFAVWISGTKG